MPTAFLSYAKEDAGHARRLYSSLLDNGIDVWFDEVSLLPGQKWKDEIERSISGCRYFIAMTSANSLSKTGYVQKELKTALAILDLHPTNQIYVIPIRIEECRIEDRKLKEIHYVDFFPDYEFGLSKLLKAIGLTSSTASREPQSQQTLEDVAASPAQIDAAKHFFDGISAKRKEI